MKKFLAGLLAATIAFYSVAPAAAQTINNLGAGRGSVIGADLFPSYQGANPAVRPSAAQIAAYVYGLMSGDATASGTGTLTLATVNGNVGTFGSATQCIITTQNAKGLTTAISAATCTPAVGSVTGWGTGVLAAVAAALNGSTGLIGALTPTNNNCIVGNGSAWTSTTCPSGGATGANPTGTAGPAAVNGASSNFMRADAAPAVQLGTAAQKGIVQVDGTTIVANSGVISSGGVAINLQTGANYPIVAGDFGKLVQLSNASAQTPTLPTAATVGANWVTNVCNINAGVQTITPTTSTIGGAASYPLGPGSAALPTCITIQSDGTNYNLVGSSMRVARGTATLGTSAIGSAACATVVTVSAPGVLTTDVVNASFNGDPTAVTGYVPLTSGMLTIIGYPTANNVNFKVCNNTTGSITPGAITLNFRVDR